MQYGTVDGTIRVRTEVARWERSTRIVLSMAKLERLIAAARNNPEGVKFRDAQKIITAMGFELARVTGSHHIYKRAQYPKIINIQDCNGYIKAYAARQIISVAEELERG